MNLYRPIRVALLLTTIGGAYVAIIFVLISKTGTPSRLALGDIRDYFDYAGGVLGGGAAYRAAASAYPFLANILFAAVRLISSLVNPSVNAFVVAWIGIAVLLYVCVLETIIVRASKLAVLMWLAPAPIYFALMRYESTPPQRRYSRYWQSGVTHIWLARRGSVLPSPSKAMPCFCYQPIASTSRSAGDLPRRSRSARSQSHRCWS
jgi:hypothetical protein